MSTEKYSKYILAKFLLLIVMLSAVDCYYHNPPFSIKSEGYGEDGKSCADAITDSLMNLNDLNAAYFVLSTGKYLNNWGAYGSCIDSVEGGTYWMVTTTGGVQGANDATANITYYTGLCVPKDCTSKDMEQLDELFEGAADFNNVTNPFVEYFSVTDYVATQQGGLTTGEIIIWATILLFAGFAGIGTIIHITKLFDKNNIKEGKISNDESASNSEEYREIPTPGAVDPTLIQKEFNNDIATLYRKKIFTTPFLAFSAIRNSLKLVSPQRNSQIHPQAICDDEKTLQLMDGMKFYAMLWIIYANTLAYTETGVVENASDKPNFFKNFLFTLFPTAYFASDVFFFLSGFIAIYSILKLRKYSVSVIFNQYLRRAFRLIPIMAFVLCTARYVIPRFVEGPLCQRYGQEFSDCDTYFWTNLLLINNLYPLNLKNGCMPWTWFFACDFQMFVLVPLIAVLFQKSKIGGYAITLIIIVCSLVFNAVQNGMSSNPGANPYLDTSYFTDIYIKPWIRAVPYYLGVYLGASFYFYIKNSDENILFNKIKYNPFLRAAMYILGFSLMFTITFVVYDYTKDYGTGWSVAAKVVYTTLSSLVFIVGLAMIILPALLNRAKLIRFLLIGPVLSACGRSTYLAALCHPVLMIAIYTTSGQQIYIEGYKMFALFVGHAFITYLIAVGIYILIEAPIRGMESIWYDSFFSQNIVENWIETSNLAKKQSDEKVKLSTDFHVEEVKEQNKED